MPELVNHAGDDVPQTQQTQPNAVDHHAEFLVGLARRPVYRQLDLESERQKAEAWIEANPSKRPKSWPRFFTNWLNRALRDQPPQTGSQPPSKEVVRRAMEATLRGQQDRGEA